MQVSAYKDIFDTNSSHTISVNKALERIRTGEKSKPLVYQIRGEKNKDKRNKLKEKLVCITFSGKFGEPIKKVSTSGKEYLSNREDECLLEHSGFICLDFDFKSEKTALEWKERLKTWQYAYAVWISPSGIGVKVLVKIKHKNKHREHFAALKMAFPQKDAKGNPLYRETKSGEKKPLYYVDQSGINESRVCYESYDPEIYINKESETWDEIYEEPKIEIKAQTKTNTFETDEGKIYVNIRTWLENRGDAFVTGERNTFIFKLAGACCRFGIDMSNAEYFIESDFTTDESDFTRKEMAKAIENAYKSNGSKFGSAKFDTDNEPYEVSKSGDVIYILPKNLMDENYRPTDVIYGEDVWIDAEKLYDDGYVGAESCHIPPLDRIFKWKKRQISALTGIGNYGKSTMYQYLAIVKALRDGDKFAVFGPENYPPEEWYFELTEIVMGVGLSPDVRQRPSKEKFKQAYDFIREHFFYVYPESKAPTPRYICGKFLELIIKRKVTGICIDPFNQLNNDYSSSGGRDDKYLEAFLGDMVRFSNDNNVYTTIINHPTKMRKLDDGNYECPDVYDLAGGAMWNNKLHNLFVYHRPLGQTDPMSPLCQFHSKKVKKTKLFQKGVEEFEFNYFKKRFIFGGVDYLAHNNEFHFEHNNMSTYEQKLQNFNSAPEPETEPPF